MYAVTVPDRYRPDRVPRSPYFGITRTRRQLERYATYTVAFDLAGSFRCPA